MSHELTTWEHGFIKRMVDAFWSDTRVTTYKNAVILYVKSHRSAFDYASCMGLYDNPQEVAEAVLQSEEYVNRSPVSAARMPVGGAVTSMAYGVYQFSDQELIAKECEAAITYWKEKVEGKTE